MAMTRRGIADLQKCHVLFGETKRGSILSTRMCEAAPKREIAMRLPLSSSPW
jgi:hypothetical protein